MTTALVEWSVARDAIAALEGPTSALGGSSQAIRDVVRAVRTVAPVEESQAIRMEVFMPYVVGLVLSLGVVLFAGYVELDRDRAFYRPCKC